MRLILPLLMLMMPMTARADVPKVVTDIAPIHSLVTQVMGDLGQPDVLVSGAASPHDFQFTFAQASAVQDADLVIWVGAGLTPWLAEALETLASDATVLTLLDSDGWAKLDRRDWSDDHDHDADHGEDHDEDTALDPHAWLDPNVAMVWTGHIANALINIDPQNAATYRSNADATIDRLVRLDQDIATQLADVPRGALLLPHDAYQYFGTRFDVGAIGTISLSDAASPSPAKIAALQTMVRDMDVICVLSDPQSRAAWVDLVRNDSDAQTSVADPMGTMYRAGPDHYDQTLRAISTAYADCLGG